MGCLGRHALSDHRLSSPVQCVPEGIYGRHEGTAASPLYVSSHDGQEAQVIGRQAYGEAVIRFHGVGPSGLGCRVVVSLSRLRDRVTKKRTLRGRCAAVSTKRPLAQKLTAIALLLPLRGRYRGALV